MQNGEEQVLQYIELYQGRVTLYGEMLEIARSQRTCLQAEEINLEQLISLIDNRQELIDRITELDRQLARLEQELDQFTEGLADYPDKTDPRLLAAKKGLLATVEEIKRLDLENGKTLGHCFEKTREALKKVRQDKKAIKSYGGYNKPGESAFLDRNA